MNRVQVHESRLVVVITPFCLPTRDSRFDAWKVHLQKNLNLDNYNTGLDLKGRSPSPWRKKNYIASTRATTVSKNDHQELLVLKRSIIPISAIICNESLFDQINQESSLARVAGSSLASNHIMKR